MKIKVSTELGKALDWLLDEKRGVYTKEKLPQVHSRMAIRDRQWNCDVGVMNHVGIMELAEILVNGYEYKKNTS